MNGIVNVMQDPNLADRIAAQLPGQEHQALREALDAALRREMLSGRAVAECVMAQVDRLVPAESAQRTDVLQQVPNLVRAIIGNNQLALYNALDFLRGRGVNASVPS